ncbi:hypothetical protein VNI00_013370 [Paramarasmius palmivorus]|uniref:Uncharacterized protein n=1 Tax=Paramarasmius palmivorus TaxID=297713 RepID=A0AAW0C3E4_9AGAR
MLQAIYNHPASDRSVVGGGSMAEFSTLCRGVNWLPAFGIPPKSVITTNKHLFSRILAYAPLYPLEVYALAGHHDLKDLATAASPYTLSMELSTMKQELAEEMGAVYLLWLFRLHTRRQSFLLKLFATPPDSHDATERCLDQRELKQKWNMVIASLTRHIKADTPPELIREHVAAHTNNITCKDCARARDARLDAILNEWARADEMTRVVRRKFDLEDDVDISFEVEEFEVCKNGRVEVDESAYMAMAPYLDEMHVVTTPIVAKKQHEPQRRSLAGMARDGASTSKGKGRELTRKESFLITPTTSIHEESTSQDRDEEPPRPSSSKLPEPAQEPEEDVDRLIDEEAELLNVTKTENKSVSLRSSATTIKPEPPIPVKPASSSTTASKPKNSRTAASSSKPPSINVPTPSKAIAASSTSKLPNLQTSTSSKPASSAAASSASKPPSPRTFAPETTTWATTSRAQPSTSDNRRADELFNESVTVEDQIVFEESVFKPSPEQNRFFLGRQFNFGASGSGKDKAKQKETTKPSKLPADDADIIDVDEEPDQRPVSSVTKALLGHSRTTTGGKLQFILSLDVN